MPAPRSILAAPALSLSLAILAAGCAAAPRVIQVPGALAAGDAFPAAEGLDLPGGHAPPFGRGEEGVREAGRVLKGGVVDGAAYVYAPDRRHALVASRPGQGPEVLGYGARDWFIECAAAGEGGCTLRMAGAARTDRPLEDALRIHLDPVRVAYVVCVGPPGTHGGALRVGGSGPWRLAGADGCFDGDTSHRLVTDLEAGDSFQYRYTGPDGADVRGWYPVFGLRPALALAGWLAAPPGGG